MHAWAGVWGREGGAKLAGFFAGIEGSICTQIKSVE